MEEFKSKKPLLALSDPDRAALAAASQLFRQFYHDILPKTDLNLRISGYIYVSARLN